MTIGISIVLLAISETTTWGWGSAKALGLIAVGLVFIAVWIAVEVRSPNPLIDMTMMRIRGVWTTNASAFLLGAGMYASFIIFPQFAQLPKSTGFGFGASVVVSGLYLLPSTIGMTILGLYAGRISARFGSRAALLAGTAFTTASFALLRSTHSHPYELLIAAGLLGVGIGLAFAALGNLIIQAVSSHADGRGERHEHGHAHARRRARRPALGDVHRRAHAPRAAGGHRLHRDVRDGDRLSRSCACSPACSCRRPGQAHPSPLRRRAPRAPPWWRARRREPQT